MFILLMSFMLFYSCSKAQTPIHIRWQANTELDMKQYHVYFWMGPDTTKASFSGNYVGAIPHPLNADSVYMDIQRSLVEGQWMIAGVTAADNSGNVSEMAFSKFVHIPNLPPKKPQQIILEIK